MNYNQRLAPILFCLAAGAASLPAQWDPQGDAALFSYVFPHTGRYINDHCLIRADSLWHLYFIDGTPGNGIDIDIGPLGGDGSGGPAGSGGTYSYSTTDWHRAGNEVKIGHATSPDLLTWTPQDSALGLGAPGSLDGAHVYAPNVIEKNGTYYMFYTGNQVSFFGGEHLFLATSTDLYHWRRYQQEPIFIPDTSWAVHRRAGYLGGAGGPSSGRDPHLYYDERYGYILYYVALLRSDNIYVDDGTYSCIAAATSPDLINWTDRGPLVVRKTRQRDLGTTWNHPESPGLVRRGDTCYLYWKGGPGTRYLKSEDPLDFDGAEEHRLATSHASEIVEWDEDWYITSCSRTVADVTHSHTDRTRGLYLAKLRWQDGRPRVAALDIPLRAPSPAGGRAAAKISPNPAVRGAIVSMRLPPGSAAGDHDVDIVDVRSSRVARLLLTAVVDESGSRVVEIPTADLHSGVYSVRVGTTVGRLVLLQ